MSRSSAPSRRLDRTRRVARLMDSSARVPGTRFRFGLDPLVGLVPLVGDGAATLASLYVVYEAARAGVPASTLLRMLLNVGVDFLLGSVPLVGDLFDATWKANERNVALFEARLAAGGGDRRFLLAVVAGLAIAVAAVVAAVAVGVWWLVGLL